MLEIEAFQLPICRQIAGHELPQVLAFTKTSAKSIINVFETCQELKDVDNSSVVDF